MKKLILLTILALTSLNCFSQTGTNKESDTTKVVLTKEVAKQVVKDLGPGFEIRPIELPVGDVDAINTLGVTWSPEAAARILKTGVPFNKGGMVERKADDNRRYM